MPEIASDAHARDPTPLRPVAPVELVSTWPRPLTGFIGRGNDIEAVGDLCRRDDVQLLTITGPGGMGKTRLSIEVAARIADTFDDGMVFVSLAALRDPGLVPVTIAEALGVPTVAGQSLDERLRSFLHYKRLLLVLDNMEHLLPAGPVVAELLTHHPALKILCTSRTRLGLSGEHIYPLAALDVEDAVRLFDQHARARDARFELTPGDRALIESICDRLDRLPLALELAASRVATLPLDALLDRLDHRLPLLTGGSRDAPERQRTMRDTIAWSYGLLTEDEQGAFRRLAIFVDGFTIDAAAAIARDGADALDLVDAHVANSLVLRTQSEFGELRFMMLETIREFGLDQLAVHDELAAVSAIHADYCITLTEGAIPHYDGPDLRMVADRVETELDNIRAAITWCLSVPDADRAVRLTGAIWRNWWSGLPPGGESWNERVAEGRDWLERALALREGLPVASLAEGLVGAATFALLQGDSERAMAYGRELLQRSLAERYSYGAFWAHHIIGGVVYEQGEIGQAVQANETALAIAPTVRNPENHAAMALTTLGMIATEEGDFPGAESYLTDAVSFTRVCGTPRNGANAMYQLGRLYRHQEKFVQAAGVLAECLDCLASQRDIGRAKFPLMELSQVAIGLERPMEAIRLVAGAMRLPGTFWHIGEVGEALNPLQTRVQEPQFAREWAVGEHMTWDELIALVGRLAGDDIEGDNDPPGDQMVGNPPGLSPREIDVLRLLVDGQSNRAIGETLSISERTVEAHVQHILAKLQAESRTGAATYAVRHGLV